MSINRAAQRANSQNRKILKNDINIVVKNSLNPKTKYVKNNQKLNELKERINRRKIEEEIAKETTKIGEVYKRIINVDPYFPEGKIYVPESCKFYKFNGKKPIKRINKDKERKNKDDKLITIRKKIQPKGINLKYLDKSCKNSISEPVKKVIETNIDVERSHRNHIKPNNNEAVDFFVNGRKLFTDNRKLMENHTIRKRIPSSLEGNLNTETTDTIEDIMISKNINESGTTSSRSQLLDGNLTTFTCCDGTRAPCISVEDFFDCCDSKIIGLDNFFDITYLSNMKNVCVNEVNYECQIENNNLEPCCQSYELEQIPMPPLTKSSRMLHHFKELLHQYYKEKPNENSIDKLLTENDINFLKNLVEADERYHELKKEDHNLLKEILISQLNQIETQEKIVDTVLQSLRKTDIPLIRQKTLPVVEKINIEDIGSEQNLDSIRSFFENSPTFIDSESHISVSQPSFFLNLDNELELDNENKEKSSYESYDDIINTGVGKDNYLGVELGSLKVNKILNNIISTANGLTEICFSKDIHIAKFENYVFFEYNYLAEVKTFCILKSSYLVMEFVLQYLSLDDLQITKEFYIPVDGPDFKLKRTNFFEIVGNFDEFRKIVKPNNRNLIDIFRNESSTPLNKISELNKIDIRLMDSTFFEVYKNCFNLDKTETKLKKLLVGNDDNDVISIKGGGDSKAFNSIESAITKDRKKFKIKNSDSKVLKTFPTKIKRNYKKIGNCSKILKIGEKSKNISKIGGKKKTISKSNEIYTEKMLGSKEISNRNTIKNYLVLFVQILVFISMVAGLSIPDITC